ncbi:MAG: DNA gyrase subunit A [Flexilinea sp.]
MENDAVNSVDIDQQMRLAYLDYAMSVIVARALPDARDGLKPVHRRILYAMQDMGIRSNGPHKKSARIVGEVLGKYHPHGDSSIYDAMARMSQDFSMRYPLVDGQGNFGSIDGDSPAAMRYTEARIASITDEMLADIDKETVDFSDNFDGTLQEPLVLPSKLPNLLLNGSSGIAVGMATNIPPHNLREIAAAMAYMIDNYDDIDNITIEDLMRYVQGPDFPTGGIILGREGIMQAYSTGRGRVVVRGRTHVEENRPGRFDIIITEIPYQINKTTLIERIAELVREGKIDTISDLRDESDRTGMRIVIELKKNGQPKQVLNQLYKHTLLQSTFGVQMLALVHNQPRTLSLKKALQIFIEHRLEIIQRRSLYELKKAKARAHILEGLLIALANLDEVIAIIRASKDTDTARNELMERFNLSELQAQAILDLQLRRLSALERMKIDEEQLEITAKITYLDDLLADPKRQLEIVEKETEDLTKKYGDDRRTTIEADAVEQLSESDLVDDQSVFITLTERGYIKRVNANVYRTYNRGAVGVAGHGLKEEDELSKLVFANTHDTVLFFTNKGKVYSEKVYRIVKGGRTDKGTPVINVINLGPEEKVTELLAVSEFDPGDFLVMVTAGGKIKRNALKDYANVRTNGIIAIGLEEDDELKWVLQTNGKLDVVMVTEKGKGLRFAETKVRSMGRTASGVRGMRVAEDDRLTCVDVASSDDYLLVVGERGIGKRTPVARIPSHGRATGGVMITNKRMLDVTGKVIAARVLHENDDVTFITSTGNVIRLKGLTIPIKGRTARGVRLVRLTEGATVAAVTSNDADAILDDVIPVSVLPVESLLDVEEEILDEPEEEIDESEDMDEENSEDSETEDE